LLIGKPKHRTHTHKILVTGKTTTPEKVDHKKDEGGSGCSSGGHKSPKLLKIDLEWVLDVFMGPPAHETGPTDPLWVITCTTERIRPLIAGRQNNQSTMLLTTSGFLVSKLYRTLERRGKNSFLNSFVTRMRNWAPKKC
jgi:hypothetical protein